jgi:hypothetical protein
VIGTVSDIPAVNGKIANLFYSVLLSGEKGKWKRKLIFKGKLMLAQQIKLVFSVYAFMVLGMFLLSWDFAK